MIKKLAWLAAGMFIGLSGCGGGSTTTAGSGIGSGGTGSYTSGPVTGLGSIIVNGVRYNVESAAVSDDDDTVGFGKADLKLGMFVEVQGADLTTGTGSTPDTGTAKVVKVASDFVGPARNITRNLDGDITSFTVFGRTIHVDGKTVYSAALINGDPVAVYGLVSADRYTATRVQRLAFAPVYKVTSKVVAWNPSTRTFSLGGRIFEYGTDVSLPSGFGVGSWVRVRVQYLVIEWAQIPVVSVRAAANGPVSSPVARVKGLVGAVNSSTRFVVNGVTVDSTSATLSDLGGGIAEGVRVEVRGRMVDGVLVAKTIEGEDDAKVEAKEIELHGRASAVGADTFVVKGMTVYFVPLTGGAIADRECVEVRGTRFNGSQQLVATEVKRQRSGCDD